jgi:phosphopantetheinyl transferase (holo-ACP synthase)
MKRISIGNDIVTLANTNAARTREKRFYSKFLTEAEVNLYSNNTSAFSFEQFAWLCWSIKESVYKFQQRLQPQLAFAAGKINIQKINIPLKPQCFFAEKDLFEMNCLPVEHCYTSLTFIGSIPFYSRSFITDELIYTVTADEVYCNNIYWGIKKIEDASYYIQSQSVRMFASQKMSQVLNSDEADILKTKAGYPFIKQYPQIPVSFTHHHQFIGYAFVVGEVT